MLKKGPLISLKDKRLNGYAVEIGKISKGRFVEEINFELYLKSRRGETSKNAVVMGKFFSGRGEFYKPWIEIYYDPYVIFKSSDKVNLSENRLDEKLFKHLSSLVPPGGHIMVFYLNHEDTNKGLQMGIPAPATPIGHLLWKAGCTWFKDWYFAEGFMEGDVKLQGDKPLGKAGKERDLHRIYEELIDFLKEQREGKLFLEAKKRAENVLKDIEKEITGIRGTAHVTS